MALICILGMASCQAQAQTHQPAPPTTEGEAATVYMTTDISPEGLVRIYEALGVEAQGRVAVKISTGESQKSNHLRPELIKNLVQKVNGTLVECNTAYGGNRGNTEKHRKAIAERGYNDIATVDIMDEEGEIQLPVKDTKHLQYDIVKPASTSCSTMSTAKATTPSRCKNASTRNTAHIPWNTPNRLDLGRGNIRL